MYTGRYDVKRYTGVFDVSGMGHYLGNETLCRKGRGGGKGNVVSEQVYVT
jgi:hypothetical protein